MTGNDLKKAKIYCKQTGSRILLVSRLLLVDLDLISRCPATLITKFKYTGDTGMKRRRTVGFSEARCVMNCNRWKLRDRCLWIR